MQFLDAFSNQMHARMETIVRMHTPAPMGSACDVALSRIVSRLVPIADAQLGLQSRIPGQEEGKGKSKGKDCKTKPTAKSGDVDFDENAQAEPDEPEEQDADQEEDPEAYLVEAHTSGESEADSDGMLDWSASERKDYKDRTMATAACACPDSSVKQSDTWEWRGPCCLVRVHRQMRRCLFPPTWKETIWQGLTVQPQRIAHVKPRDQSFLSPENVKSVDLLRSEKLHIHGQARLILKSHQMLVAKCTSHQRG